MVDYSLKVKAEERINGIMEKARKYWPGIQFNNPKVSFDLVSTRTAGRARFTPATGACAIELSPALLNVHGEHFIENTVVHEAAHIIAFAVFPRAKAHGSEWKSVMRWLGKDPKRCHDYNVREALEANGITPRKRRTVKRVTYRCGCMTHEITVTRHNKLKSGAIRARCVHCKQTITEVK